MRWRYYLLIVGSALALMGADCTPEGQAVPCEEDAECVDNCTAACDRRGEELLSYRCDANRACQCTCSPSGTGGAGGAGGGAGPGGGNGSV